MEKNKLLSIGAFSKLSGANIKSLRYYDQIGVLPPAYVDPDTGYRYYALAQVHVVDAIQLCLELDIPLKQFPQFLNGERRQIHYARLLEQGRQLAQEKIRSIRARLDFLNQAQENLQRSRQLQQEGSSQRFRLEQTAYLLLPYTGEMDTEEYYHGIDRLFHRAKELRLRPRFEFGLLWEWGEQPLSQWIFLDISLDSLPCPMPEDLRQFPAGEYLFFSLEESGIRRAPELFPELFSRPSVKTVVEVESIPEISDPDAPLFELRCSLFPSKKEA